MQERLNSQSALEFVSEPSRSPEPSPPPASSAVESDGEFRGGPYSGDFNACSWNATALLAADPAKQRAKMAKAVGLCMTRDFVIVEESHSPEGRCELLKLPRELSAHWSHDSAAKGGIGIILNQDFLKKFDKITNANWIEILPGYVAILRLRGPLGSLDICCCYFPTGGSESSSLRKELMEDISKHIAPKEDVLTIMAANGGRLQLCGEK